jgi:acetyltransferase-like isoleucine patch superfamily enzyme
LSNVADKMKPEAPVKLAIFGGKGGGCHAAQTALNSDRSGGLYTFAGYLNDRLPPGSTLLGGKVLCSFDAWPQLDSDLVFLAPLHKVGFMQQNCTRLIKLGVPISRWAMLIDPMAAVADNAEIGLGTYLVSFASIGPDSKVGSHCALRQGAVVGNDVVVGDFVFVGANAMLCSGSKIASGAHIAPGAQVGNDVKVGRFAVVGLGAVVTRDVPDYAVVAGNPARLLREIEPVDVPSWSFQS